MNYCLRTYILLLVPQDIDPRKCYLQDLHISDSSTFLMNVLCSLTGKIFPLRKTLLTAGSIMTKIKTSPSKETLAAMEDTVSIVSLWKKHKMISGTTTNNV